MSRVKLGWPFVPLKVPPESIHLPKYIKKLRFCKTKSEAQRWRTNQSQYEHITHQSQARTSASSRVQQYSDLLSQSDSDTVHVSRSLSQQRLLFHRHCIVPLHSIPRKVPSPNLRIAFPQASSGAEYELLAYGLRLPQNIRLRVLESEDGGLEKPAAGHVGTELHLAALFAVWLCPVEERTCNFSSQPASRGANGTVAWVLSGRGGEGEKGLGSCEHGLDL